jgi:hypothetical protein
VKLRTYTEGTESSLRAKEKNQDMIKKLFILLLISQPLLAQQNTLQWPEITKESKPWTRWWWPGSIATEKDMTAALQKYSNAGLGGMELTVLYGIRGEEEKFVKFLSPEWMKMFQHIINESQRLNLGIDLANASSWPFGGPWVTPDDASKYVAYKTWSLKEGESLPEKIEYFQEPFIRWNGTFRTDIKNLADPVYLNANMQELAIDQIRFEKPLPVQLIMAYSSTGQSVDITDKIDKEGNLNWITPKGEWTIYAVFIGWHGKMVERAGPGGEGYVIDHFSGKAVNDYLARFDEAFKGYDLSYLRGYFNDSYEVDDARGQSCWTPEIFSEFKERRGYDLRDNLPALFQKDDPDKNARVLCDYRQTISDLILDKFTRTWTGWANSQKKITRNQSHGSPGNIPDLYAASDIPETEGTDILKMKFGTSAANVSGKKYASAEATTWLGEHFSSTLLDVKKNVDRFFLAGVNHIFYHGTCFSPVGEPWPGFQFYAAAEFSPANSFWNDLPILNSYIARVQSFMQSTKPDNDVLLYFPIFDRYSDYNNLMIEHFDAISPRFNGSNFKSAAEKMNEKGFAFDYISDRQIEGLLADGSVLWTGGVSYKTLVLPKCKYIPVGTFNRIINLAEKGATIILYGGIPENFSGWSNLGDNRELFTFLAERLNFKPTTMAGITRAEVGSGYVLTGNDLETLLSAASVRRESLTDSGLEFNRRKSFNNTCYYILNPSDKPFQGWVSLSLKSKSAAIFDPMTGSKGLAKIRISGGNTEVYIRLQPSQSLVIQVGSTRVAGEPFRYYDKAGDPVGLTGDWSVRFIEGGPVIPEARVLKQLSSWTLFGDENYGDFSGTAEYSIKLKKPEAKAEFWLLSLGRVCESARIILNGQELPGLIGPDYQLVINNEQLNTENKLIIRVSNLSANRIAYLDRNNVNWKKFYNTNYPARLPQNRKNGLFDASSWTPRESGLIGPVTLTPLKKMK